MRIVVPLVWLFALAWPCAAETPPLTYREVSEALKEQHRLIKEQVGSISNAEQFQLVLITTCVWTMSFTLDSAQFIRLVIGNDGAKDLHDGSEAFLDEALDQAEAIAKLVKLMMVEAPSPRIRRLAAEVHHHCARTVQFVEQLKKQVEGLKAARRPTK